MNTTSIIYVLVIPVLIIIHFVWLVLFFLSPTFLSPMGCKQRLLVELRGAHLVWWLAWAGAFSAAVSGLALDLHRCLFGGLVAVAIGGAVAKVYVPLAGYWAAQWLPVQYHNGRYESWGRYYLFWARGILSVAIALAPGLAYILWCLASGWLAGRAP